MAHLSLIDEMREAYGQLEHDSLRDCLMDSIVEEQSSLQQIEESFRAFTSAKHSLNSRRTFFSSWQKTNNSAMSVEGLANRISAEGEAAVERGEPKEALGLFGSCARLNRVADEDLGVGGKVLHFELYYQMATGFCDQDDLWQSRQYCLPEASAFKSWLDQTRLREEIMQGQYSMLVHEGYTHAELEMIAPLFQRWAVEDMGYSPGKARALLAWISVHNGGTEKRHFAHVCSSVTHYLQATGEEANPEEATKVFRTYLKKKAAAMAGLTALR